MSEAGIRNVLIDLAGQRFSRLTVLSYIKPGRWQCRCDCGVITSIKSQDIRTGHSKSCGCGIIVNAVARNRARGVALSGTYGRLTVVRKIGPSPSGSLWEFVCACGKTHVTTASRVLRGHVRSCGCLKSELVRKRMTGKQFCLKHDLGDLRGKERKKAYIRMRLNTDPVFRAKADIRCKRRKEASANGNISAQQWLTILECFGHACAYCGDKNKRLGQDHIVPLVKGGTHTWDNVVPACRSCNSKKHARTLGVAMQALGTDKEKFWHNISKAEQRLAS